MKIKALRTLHGDAGIIRRDAEADVSDGVGKSLIKRGLAVEIDGKSRAKRTTGGKAVKSAAAPKQGD